MQYEWQQRSTRTLTSSLKYETMVGGSHSRDRKCRKFKIFKISDFAKISKYVYLVMMTAYRRGAPMPRGAGSSTLRQRRSQLIAPNQNQKINHLMS